MAARILSPAHEGLGQFAEPGDPVVVPCCLVTPDPDGFGDGKMRASSTGNSVTGSPASLSGLTRDRDQHQRLESSSHAGHLSARAVISGNEGEGRSYRAENAQREAAQHPLEEAS
jgi:hypothetical protein